MIGSALYATPKARFVLVPASVELPACEGTAENLPDQLEAIDPALRTHADTLDYRQRLADHVDEAGR